MNECKSLLSAWSVADLRADAGDAEAASAIRFCAASAEQYRRWLRKLAWASQESSARKRKAAMDLVMMEMDAADESCADLPMRSAPGQ